MSRPVADTVMELKTALAKEYEKGEENWDSDRCMDVLKQLEAQPITLKVLSDTLVGTIVSKFKSAEKVPDLASEAKNLVKKWKKLAKSATTTESPKQAARPKVTPPQTEMRPTLTKNGSTSKITGPAIKRPSNVISIAMPEEWTKLPNLRQNICKKLLEILSMSAKKNGQEKFSRDDIISKVTAVEAAIESCGKGDRAIYGEKARQLSFNLKKNGELRWAVLQGTMETDKLTTLSPDELCSQELQREREAEALRLQESRRLDWEQANETKINEMCGIKGDLLKASLFTCGRCKSTKTTSTQKQTRSADEPMTVFVLCTNCGKRWKC